MTRGPAKGSYSASRSGPHGLAQQAAKRATRREDAPLPTEPPEYLPPAAAAVWRRLLPCVLSRTIAADLDVFAAYCLTAARLAELARSRKGRVRARDQEFRAQARTLAMLARELGLSPAARAKLPPPQEVDEFDEREAIIASLVR